MNTEGILVLCGEGVWLLASLAEGWDSLKWERVVVLNTEGMGL